MSGQAIRWEQRFANYKRALAKLKDVVDSLNSGEDKEGVDHTPLSDLEIEGVIQRFENTHELAWNVMKDYIIYQGDSSVGGSRDATREAFKMNLISDAQGWMNMIKSRNLTSHTYDETTAKEIFSDIIQVYYPLFSSFYSKMLDLKSENQKGLFSEEL